MGIQWGIHWNFEEKLEIKLGKKVNLMRKKWKLNGEKWEFNEKWEFWGKKTEIKWEIKGI